MRRGFLAAALTFLALAPPALAAPPPTIAHFCGRGSEAGQCEAPGAIAADPADGHVYVADRGNRRIDVFDPWGQFLYAFGWDVISSGPGKSSNDEVQRVRVAAESGTFALSFKGQTTAAIEFDASPQELEAALDALSTIGGAGGSVSVSGGPGNPTGSSPYVVTFGGALGGEDVPQLELHSAALGHPAVGAQLRCPVSELGEASVSYQWLRNGSEIAGATAETYAVVAADAGKAIQCRILTEGYGTGAGVIKVANPAIVPSPPPATAPPVAPSSIELPHTSDESKLVVGSPGGQTLTCNPNAAGWQGAPSFAYEWYRNGAPIAGATASTYTVTTGDLATPAFFQCAVSGTNAGGAVTKASALEITSPGFGYGNATPSVEASSVLTANTGGGVEACTEACRSAAAGSGPGQFSALQGISLDSAGDLYVVDLANRRVQKFDPEGHFLLMFGGEVDKTKVALREEEEANSEPLTVSEAEENLCTAASGDECGAGARGSGQGQFAFTGEAEISGTVSAVPVEGDYIAVGPGSPQRVYVGDDGRIQVFDTGGHYLEDLPDPGKVLEPEAGKLRAVNSLAVDPTDGSLYLTSLMGGSDSKSWPGVVKLSASGAKLCEIGAHNPKAVAVGATGKVYVVQGLIGTSNEAREIVSFDSACGGEEALFGKEGVAGSVNEFSGDPAGIAVSSPPTCGLEGPDLYLSNGDQLDTFVGLYGPPPDPTVCPQPAQAPTIAAQYAVTVGGEEATVKAKIDPHFWPDTTYYVQYGTGRCSEGGCPQTALYPGSALGAGLVSRDVASEGVALGEGSPLSPDTTYHYRFVARSGGGGPVYGEDPDGKGPEEASEAEGLEGSFHTYPVGPADAECPNQSLRVGAGAALPDCRAYEMVTPVDKADSDVSTPSEGHDLSSAGGDRLTYTSLAAAYAGSTSSPFAHQYLSSRGAAGWSTQSIAAPQKLPLLYNPGDAAFLGSEFKVFSEDLCEGWVLQEANVALAPGAPPRVPNLYRRENCGGSVGAYELLTPVAPPGWEAWTEENLFYFPKIQGLSADDSLVVFRAPAAMTADASSVPDIYQLYAEREGELHLVSVLPNGTAAATHASAGTTQDGGASYKGDSVYHAVSADGRRIYWSASEEAKSPRQSGTAGSGDQPGALYVRVNPTEPQSALKLGKCTEPEKACTVAIVKSGARFIAASAAGDTAIFMAGGSLYEFNLAKGLAKEAGAVRQIAEGVDGVMGASEDVRRVYFVSGKVCSGETQNPEGATAQAGQANLYLYERGESCEEGQLRYIATVSGPDIEFAYDPTGSTPSLIARLPYQRTSRVSPDGLHAAFLTTTPITGVDNADLANERPDAEAYVYDATAAGGSGALWCASCSPGGARPTGREVWSGSNGAKQIWAAATIPGWIDQLRPGRFLAADGTRLFFESYDSLLPTDTNGKADVYEWERPGAGDCDADNATPGPRYFSQNGGCLALISSGKSADDSLLVDASDGGADVFFTTRSSLVGSDPGLRDVYDARVDGGFAEPPAPAPACEGEACQSPPAAPQAATPASAAFAGPGNLAGEAPPRRACPKGRTKVRLHGKARCVKRRHRRHVEHRHHRRAEHEGRAAR